MLVAEPVPDRNAVRSPATVIAQPYEPASRREVTAGETVAAEVWEYRENATFGTLREQTSALATQFGRSGGLDRDPWWNAEIQQSILGRAGTTLSIGLDEIYRRTLSHSNQVRVLAGIPLIRETAIDEAEGRFAVEAFSESRYDRRNEPSGSNIERDQPGDLSRDRSWIFRGGLRKRTQTGAQISLGQELSQESSNAEFFIPREQGRARATLSIMQPLLKGAGTAYNRSQIQIAKLETENGYNEFIGELENHLVEVNLLYWRLYLARGVLLEKRRLVAATEETVAEIESRSDLDSIASQRSRARAALASRKADLIRSELEIKNAESRLRTLVNDPSFIADKVGEIVPSDSPIATMAAPDFEESMSEALSLRTEIRMAENTFRAADLRELIAENEKRPIVDFVGEVGTSTLRGSGDWTGAFNEQYNGGEPTWGVGVVASVPLGRKVEKAKLLRAQLEARQARDQLRATMDQVLLDVQIAHREVVTAWPDARAKWEAAVAAEQELSVLRDRRDVETAESGASLYLETLLDAQQRRARAREEFLTALATYNAALTNLDRAKGTLLQAEDIGVRRIEDDRHLPLVELIKDEASAKARAVYDSYK
jgi:outer membrane protein TolC